MSKTYRIKHLSEYSSEDTFTENGITVPNGWARAMCVFLGKKITQSMYQEVKKSGSLLLFLHIKTLKKLNSFKADQKFVWGIYDCDVISYEEEESPVEKTGHHHQVNLEDLNIPINYLGHLGVPLSPSERQFIEVHGIKAFERMKGLGHPFQYSMGYRPHYDPRDEGRNFRLLPPMLANPFYNPMLGDPYYKIPNELMRLDPSITTRTEELEDFNKHIKKSICKAFDISIDELDEQASNTFVIKKKVIDIDTTE